MYLRKRETEGGREREKREGRKKGRKEEGRAEEGRRERERKKKNPGPAATYKQNNTNSPRNEAILKLDSSAC